MDRAYVDFSLVFMFYIRQALFSSFAPSRTWMPIGIYSAPSDRTRAGVICDQTIALDGFYTKQDYPDHLRRIRFKDPETGKTLVFLTNQTSHFPHCHYLHPLQESLAGGTVFQVDQATPAHQTVLRHLPERGQVTNLDRCLGLRPGCHRPQASRSANASLYTMLQISLRHASSRKLRIQQALDGVEPTRALNRWIADNQPIESIRVLTGH